MEYDNQSGTNSYIIPASNIAPEDLSHTLERVKIVPEKLEM